MIEKVNEVAVIHWRGAINQVIDEVNDLRKCVNTMLQHFNPPRDHAEDHKTMDVTVTLTWEEASSIVHYVNLEESGPGYERAFKKIKQAMENRK